MTTVLHSFWTAAAGQHMCIYAALNRNSSNQIRSMSTALFWILFCFLLCIMVVEILMLAHKIDPWISTWLLRRDSTANLAMIEKRSGFSFPFHYLLASKINWEEKEPFSHPELWCAWRQLLKNIYRLYLWHFLYWTWHFQAEWARKWHFHSIAS